MKMISSLFLAGLLLAGTALAQSPVTLTIDTRLPGYTIPDDFSGVSIFTGTQVLNHRGTPGNLFSAKNTQLITLFKNAGLNHLRLGATGSPDSDSQNLSHADIDSLFAFAKATDIKIIYSLHYADGVAAAKYVWDNYRAHLDCFAFDNEPDSRLNENAGKAATDHRNYFDSWKDFAKSVTDAVPGAKFAGPDAAGRTLVARFVEAEKDSGCLALVTQHTYVGGNSRKRGIDAPHAADSMLSKDWVTDKYPQLYRTVLKPVAKQGLPFRITELDDHVHGVTNASDAFVSALWALDVMHWWAAHGAAGIDFQNTAWLPTDTFRPDAAGNYQVNPKACGIRAFDLGGHGRVEPVTSANPDELNLTAYAVANGSNLFVTIINKEHGPGARAAAVTIAPDGILPANAAAMFLTAPDGNLQAIHGVTLGGAPITNDAPWVGKWTALNSKTNGQCTVTVPPASAAVVKLAGRSIP
jgi:hypothetical protein